MTPQFRSDEDGRAARVGIVVIGRNEGERLRRCLVSVAHLPARVYVDSGSTDGSVALARAMGVTVVELPVPPAFTAARARNAGIDRLRRDFPGTLYVQALDGDCEVLPGWLAAGADALDARPELALVFGRLHEKHPERSIYNALCDDEWNVPIGEVPTCGGNVMLRVEAFQAAGGYDDRLIAGEEPDMSVRIRALGWRLARVDSSMALHDAAITRFGQWWRRTRRSGHAFAELAYRHPDARWPDWRSICRRIVIWGGVLPLCVLLSLIMSAAHDPRWLVPPLLAVMAFFINVVRIAFRQRRRGLSARVALASGWFLMLGKFPEFLGIVGFHRDRLLRRKSTIIEYKDVTAS